MATALGKSWQDYAVEQRELGKAEGEVKGKVEGKAEGELQTARDILRSVLEERFGELPPEVLQKIATSTDVDRLKARVRDVLHMQSLDDFEIE